jgi:hypothetical protein
MVLDLYDLLVWAGDGEGAGDPPAGDPPAGEQSDDLGEEFKDVQIPTEVQKKLNAVLKKEKEKMRTDKQKLLGDLQTLQKNVNLSDAERKQLATQIETLKRETMTRAALEAEERTKLKNEFDETSKKLTSERDYWQNLYSDSTIERSLVDAAAKHQAFDNEQVVLMLKGRTSLQPSADDPKKLVPRVSVETINEEGKKVTLSLDPSEAVERMTKEERYFNLFRTTAKGGLGSGNAGGSLGNLDPSKIAEIAKNPELYEKFRDQILSMVE